MRQSVVEAVRAAAVEIVANYAPPRGGQDQGFAHVKRLLNNTTDDAINRLVVRELFEALYTLTCPSSRPSLVVDRLEAATRSSVRRAHRDTTAVLEASFEMTGTFASNANP
eukprot:3320000-Prymnesium_polylepis.1